LKPCDPITWGIDAQKLERICRAAKSASAPGALALSRFLSSDQSDSAQLIDDLPSVGELWRLESIDEAFWWQCLASTRELRDRLHPGLGDKAEQTLGDDIATAWLRRAILGAWLRKPDLEKNAREQVVHFFIGNYGRLHNALKDLTFRHALRLFPRFLRRAKPPTCQRLFDRTERPFEWVFDLGVRTSSRPVRASARRAGERRRKVGSKSK
jgi:hypothetical protein